jgi:hypothetical protein
VDDGHVATVDFEAQKLEKSSGEGVTIFRQPQFPLHKHLHTVTV